MDSQIDTPQAPPTAPSPQEIARLRSVTTEMFSETMEGGEDKVLAFKSKYPDLAEKYPAIFVMCCGKFEDAKHKQFAMRCVSFMLKKLDDSHDADSLHNASAHVGEMLFDEYIKPVVGDAEAAHSLKRRKA